MTKKKTTKTRFTGPFVAANFKPEQLASIAQTIDIVERKNWGLAQHLRTGASISEAAKALRWDIRSALAVMNWCTQPLDDARMPFPWTS
jgi:hypothetical protein